MNGALSGIRVAAFTHFAAGPLAAQFLGALGADVIKVEAPYGDLNRTLIRDPSGRFPVSPYFITLNRNQRAIGLNLRSPEGTAVARRLIETADILVENQKPGSLAKFGLGYEDAKTINPRIIYCSISGFDLMGPKGSDLGQDLLMQGLSGLASLTGRETDPPVPVGSYVIDAYTSFACVIGALAALRHREETGEGQWVRVDMMSAALHMLAQEASYVMNVDPVTRRGRSGIAHPDQSAPYGAYEASDGAFVVSLSSPEVTARLAERLGILDDIGDWLNDQGIRDHRDEITDALARAFKRMDRDEALRTATEAGLWAAPARSLAEALEDPAVTASPLLREVETAYGGRYRFVMEPLTMSETPIEFSRPAPAPGEHTRDVLSELGYTEDDLQRFIDSGVVSTAG